MFSNTFWFAKEQGMYICINCIYNFGILVDVSQLPCFACESSIDGCHVRRKGFSYITRFFMTGSQNFFQFVRHDIHQGQLKESCRTIINKQK